MVLRSSSIFYATSLVSLTLLTGVDRSSASAIDRSGAFQDRSQPQALNRMTPHGPGVKQFFVSDRMGLTANPTVLLSGGRSATTVSLLATKVSWSSRLMDWLVPGILGTATVVGLVGAVMLMRKGPIAEMPPEPMIYSPVPPVNLPQANSPQASSPQASSPQAMNPEIMATSQATTPSTISAPSTIPIEAIAVLPQNGSNDRLQDTIVPAESNVTSEAGSLSAPPELTRLARLSIMETLVQDLKQTDPSKRQGAIWELGQRGDTRAVQPLVSLLANSDSQQRSLILSALAEISSRTLKPMSRALALSLQDESPEVRKNAIRDLTRIYELVGQISPLLQAAADDQDAEVRETAVWAIAQLNRIKTPL